jgi:hypothetical protein
VEQQNLGSIPKPGINPKTCGIDKPYLMKRQPFTKRNNREPEQFFQLLK